MFFREFCSDVRTKRSGSTENEKRAARRHLVHSSLRLGQVRYDIDLPDASL